MARTVERIHAGPSELRSGVFEQVGDGIDLVLDLWVQTAELRHELAVELDRPVHGRRMLSQTYEAKNIYLTSRVRRSRGGDGASDVARGPEPLLGTGLRQSL